MCREWCTRNHGCSTVSLYSLLLRMYENMSWNAPDTSKSRSKMLISARLLILQNHVCRSGKLCGLQHCRGQNDRKTCGMFPSLDNHPNDGGNIRPKSTKKKQNFHCLVKILQNTIERRRNCGHFSTMKNHQDHSASGRALEFDIRVNG